MININFLKIEIQNFKSIGEKTVFEFSKHSGLNYIFGINKDIEGTTNGVGKSTIFVDAVLFALFGKTLKNTKNSYIPNRIFADKMPTIVSLEFLVNDKKYKTSSIIKKSNYPVSFKLYEFVDNDWKDISKSSTNKTKEFLSNEIIRYPFELFINSIILSSSNSYHFFQMDKRDKVKYIENIFNITCFSEMCALIRSDLNALNKKI